MNRMRLLLLLCLMMFALACQTTDIIAEYLSPSPTPTRARTATRAATPASLQTSTSPPVAIVATPTLAEITGTTTANAIIRVSPSTGAAIAARANKGESLKLVGRTEASDWFQVVIPSNASARGWISKTVIQASGTDQLPVVQTGNVPPPYPRP